MAPEGAHASDHFQPETGSTRAMTGPPCHLWRGEWTAVSGLFSCILEALGGPRCPEAGPEREICIDNLLVRVHLIIEMSRPALRHGSLDSFFQVALYLPS